MIPFPKGACYQIQVNITLESTSDTQNSSSDLIQIGIVGLGFGRSILETLQRDPARKFFSLGAVCDLNEKAAAEAARRWSVPAYTSLDALLEDPAIPVVGLFTPPAGRAALIRRAIRAGKDVLTTKPFEVDALESRAVLDEARELGRVVHLNSPQPLLPPDLALIDRWRAEYDLGRVTGARAAVWAPYHEQADGTWLDDPERCPAAPLFRLGVYLFNDLDYLLGPAKELQLMTSSFRTGRRTPDIAQINLRHADGALGHISASFCVEDGDAYQNSLVVHFERGTVYRNVGGLRTRFDPDAAEMTLVQRTGRGRETVAQAEVRELSGTYQWAALAEAVRKRRPLTADYAERIVRCIDYVDALRRAQHDGAACLSSLPR